MQDHHSDRSVPLSLVAGLSAVILATGSAVAWWSWHSASRTVPTPTTEQPTQPESQSPPRPEGRLASPNPARSTTQTPAPQALPIPAEKTLQVYWLRNAGNQIELVTSPVKVSSTDDVNSALKVALEQLLAGPSNSEMTTTIPDETQLRSLSVRQDGIHIDLSQQFKTGGGSASMTGRVAQILYTATSLNPDAQVWLSIEGKPLETLGGEGLMLDQPVTRKSFERDFSL